LASSAILNIKTFCSNFKLQKAILTYIVNTLASNEEKEELMKTF